MSYQKLVDANVNRAFNLIKDLASNVTLTRKNDPKFDFASATAKFSGSLTVSTKAVVLDSKKKSDDRNTVKRELLLKSKEIGDINEYSTVLINGVQWNIGATISNDEFVTVAEVYREV